MREEPVSQLIELRPETLTRTDWACLWWGFAWRGVVIMAGGFVVSMILAFVFGVITGVIIESFGGEVSEYRLLIRCLGSMIGLTIALGAWVFWPRWLLSARFGSMRIAIVRAVPDQNPISQVAGQIS